ncbi:hypothetical protein SPLA10_PHROGS00110 [Salmonella phage SPLA10]|nr:hypothetical protein SPLA10_PHROGS00110 [Salmonella phage SPLA10]
MSMYRRFYGWENFYGSNSASNFSGKRYEPFDTALSWAFRRDNKLNLAVATIRGDQLNSNLSTVVRTSLVSNSTLMRVDKTNAGSEGSLLLRLESKEKGITRFGLRMTRGNLVSAPTLYVTGSFSIINGTEVWSAYSFAYSAGTQVYVEIEIDWGEKIAKFYMNDALNGTIEFTSLSSIYLGSFVKPSYVRTQPGSATGGSTLSWAYNGTNRYQSWGDMYLTYWDGEGDDDGRYGPIHCVRLPPKDLIVGGSLKGYSTNSQFTDTTQTFDQYSNVGVLTSSVNAETSVAFDQIDGTTVNGEVLGYSFSVSGTENDNTQPLAIDANIYHGEKEVPLNSDIQVTPLTGSTPNGAYPNTSVGYIPASELAKGEVITLGAKLVRRK